MTDNSHSSAAARGKTPRTTRPTSPALVDDDDGILSGEGELVEMLLAGGTASETLTAAAPRREASASRPVAARPTPKPAVASKPAPKPRPEPTTVAPVSVTPIDTAPAEFSTEEVDPSLLSELDEEVRILGNPEPITPPAQTPPETMMLAPRLTPPLPEVAPVHVSAPPVETPHYETSLPPVTLTPPSTQWLKRISGNRPLAWSMQAHAHALPVIKIDLATPVHLHSAAVACITQLLDEQRAALYPFYNSTPRHQLFAPLLDFIAPHSTRNHVGMLRYYDTDERSYTPYLLSQPISYQDRAWYVIAYGPHAEPFNPTHLYLVDAAYTCE